MIEALTVLAHAQAVARAAMREHRGTAGADLAGDGLCSCEALRAYLDGVRSPLCAGAAPRSCLCADRVLGRSSLSSVDGCLSGGLTTRAVPVGSFSRECSLSPRGAGGQAGKGGGR